jgi:RNA methyltransferase, RsmD family
MMRIITGTARGIRLETLEGETTRPTIERVKEAVFSMIQFDIEDRRVLDLFAGSGQLGLEALSRGALKAVFVDNDREASEIVKRNAQKTKLYEKCTVLNTDYQQYIRNSKGKEKFDLIFLDPPYQTDMLDKALNRIVECDILHDNGMIVCESDRIEPLSAEGMELVKHAKYGKVYVTILLKPVTDGE